MKFAVRVSIVLGATALAAAVAYLASDLWPRDRRGGAAAAAPPPRRPTHELTRIEPRDPTQLTEVLEDLLRDGSAAAWVRIATLYRAADEAAKSRILQEACHTSDLKQALQRVLSTVGDDITPLEDDPLIEEAAGLLSGRWSAPADLAHGRELLLLQKTERRRWVLAKAMITFVAEVPDDSPFQQEKTRLSTKLIDVHATSASGFVRASIAEGMRQLGANDVSLILAKGPSLDVSQLEVVKAERAAQAKAREALAREYP